MLCLNYGTPLSVRNIIKKVAKVFDDNDIKIHRNIIDLKQKSPIYIPFWKELHGAKVQCCFLELDRQTIEILQSEFRIRISLSNFELDFVMYRYWYLWPKQKKIPKKERKNNTKKDKITQVQT